jgi:hypothetical protein
MGKGRFCQLGGFRAAVVLGCSALLAACAGPSEPAPVIMGVAASTADVVGPVASDSQPTVAPAVSSPRAAVRQAPLSIHSAKAGHSTHRVASNQSHRSATADGSHRKAPRRAMAHPAPARKHAKVANAPSTHSRSASVWVSPQRAVD